MTPNATDPESKSAMMVSDNNSVRSFSHIMSAATSKLNPTIGTVGSAKPNQKPSATPANAECDTVSLKNAIRLAMTNTPSNAQSGPRQRAASKARCMNGSVTRTVMVFMMVAVMVMLIMGNVDAVGLLQ